MMTSLSRFAVIMGDIVDSEKHTDTLHLHTDFNAAIDRQNEALGADIVSPLTITLGDEFQGLVNSLLVAANAAREIRFELMQRNIDCRFVIGIVELKTRVNHERAWNMMGPGFARARQRLNEKRSPNRYRFSVLQDVFLETMLEAIGATVSAVERRWSDAQRDDIIRLLQGASVAEVAHARNVSVHNVYKVRSAGDFDLYVIQWNAIHEALKRLDHHFELPGAEKWRTHSFTQL